MAFEKPISLPYASGDRKQSSHKDFLLDVLDGHARIHRMLLELAGPSPEDTGIIPFGPTPESSGLVEQQTVANMTVKFNKALGFVNKCPFYIGSVTNSSALTSPVGDDRIDVVYIDPALQVYAISTGTEDASPVPNVIDETVYTKVAEIYLRVGGTSIKNIDDSANHYITPMQNFYTGYYPPRNPVTLGTIFIPGGYLVPTADLAPSTGIETAAYDVNNLTYQLFNSATAQVASFEFVLPLDYDNTGLMQFMVNWSTPDTSSDSIGFELYYVPLADNAQLTDRTVEDSDSLTDANGGAADRRRVSGWSTGATLTSDPGTSYMVVVQVPTESGMIADDIRVHSITMKYTKLRGE